MNHDSALLSAAVWQRVRSSDIQTDQQCRFLMKPEYHRTGSSSSIFASSVPYCSGSGRAPSSALLLFDKCVFYQLKKPIHYGRINLYKNINMQICGTGSA
jgi:hypothetical protein